MIKGFSLKRRHVMLWSYRKLKDQVLRTLNVVDRCRYHEIKEVTVIARVSIRSCHWHPVLFVYKETDKQISKYLLVFVRVFVSSVACSRLSDSGENVKEKSKRKVYFRVCAFSIQRTRLSRSLEQAMSSVTVLSPKVKNRRIVINQSTLWIPRFTWCLTKK